MAVQHEQEGDQTPYSHFSESGPVRAPIGDPHGFSAAYQRYLRNRIIGQHVAQRLGPLPKGDTIPIEEGAMQHAPTSKNAKGVIATHIAPNLVTSNEQLANGRGGRR